MQKSDCVLSLSLPPSHLSRSVQAESACGPRGESRTPLHVAAEHGHSENVRLLVEHGGSLLTRDSLGLTAMDLAEKGDHKECMMVRSDDDLKKY